MVRLAGSMSVAIMISVFTPDANAQSWSRNDSVFNPSGVFVQNFSAPQFADLNGDGFVDLLLGNGSSNPVDYFMNLGSILPPRLRRDTSVLASIYAGGMSGRNSDYPVACDLNTDRKIDLVIGGFNGLLLYMNIGDSVLPEWQFVDSVFAQVNTLIGTDAKPAFADLDGDGDLDLLVGIGESLFGGPTPGITMGFRNIGSPSSPQFVQDSTLVIGIPDIGLNSYPALKDVDGDGDFDLLLGRDLATLVYFRNTGTPTVPTWTQNSTTFSGVEGTTYWKDPTFTDIDRDGDYDLIYGTSDGTLYVYENTGTPTSPQFVYNPSYFGVVRISGNASTVSLGDFDNDGDMDMISGDWLGRFQHFRNDGSPLRPSFTKATATFSTLDAGSYSSPVFVDIDGDGDLDIVSGALDGMVYCYIDTGAGFIQNTTMFSGIDVGWRSAPAFADIDNDGDLDMLVGAETGSSMQFYKNAGSNAFVADNSYITGVTSPSDGHPTFVDLDRDGDYDLVIGGLSGSLLYYENTGTPSSPVWSRDDAVLAGLSVDQDAAPAFADMDDDGKPDVIIGEYNGNFSYYKNQLPTSVENGSPLPTRFELGHNYPNPFNPSTRIQFTIPAGTYGRTSLQVYDVLGREVATLVNEAKPPGRYQVTWDARNIASGVYFYKLTAGEFAQTKKLLLLR